MLILASASPFRRMLLENAGIAFTWKAAAIDERAIEVPLAAAGATPEDLALHLAEAKAADVAGRYPDALVIGSDQTLSLDGKVFHKPESMIQAQDHLRRLSGRTHKLNSAVVLLRDRTVVWSHISTARLTMRPLADDFLRRHLKRVSDRVLSSVGAYQLEGEGVQLFDRIEGDYFTILGLPLLPLLAALREQGAVDA